MSEPHRLWSPREGLHFPHIPGATGFRQGPINFFSIQALLDQCLSQPQVRQGSTVIVSGLARLCTPETKYLTPGGPYLGSLVFVCVNLGPLVRQKVMEVGAWGIGSSQQDDRRGSGQGKPSKACSLPVPPFLHLAHYPNSCNLPIVYPYFEPSTGWNCGLNQRETSLFNGFWKHSCFISLNSIKITRINSLGMARWLSKVKVLATKSDFEFDSKNQHGGRREQTLASWLQTSTCLPWVHIHTKWNVKSLIWKRWTQFSHCPFFPMTMSSSDNCDSYFSPGAWSIMDAGTK